ncbi:hypothetical protein ACF0H5_021409 [Mactra antiquata]
MPHFNHIWVKNHCEEPVTYLAISLANSKTEFKINQSDVIFLGLVPIKESCHFIGQFESIFQNYPIVCHSFQTGTQYSSMPLINMIVFETMKQTRNMHLLC